MTGNGISKWTVDPNHSVLQFKVKHLAISNVAGIFKLFRGEVETTNEDFNDAKVLCIIDADSIDTNNLQRDKDLKSSDFFNTQQFKEIKFEGLLKKKNDKYALAGELAIRETIKSIVMEAEFTGVGKGRFGDIRAGFEITGKLNRKDFGLTWNMLTEGGGFIIGEEIRLHFDIQIIKQAT
jgi:polyisoprenoid-binding protein YceI